MVYKIVYERKFEKELKLLDRKQGKLILSWIKTNLDCTLDPRQKGKALKGDFKGFWRYRIGNYRVIAEIKDDKLILILITVSHRKNIYSK